MKLNETANKEVIRKTCSKAIRHLPFDFLHNSGKLIAKNIEVNEISVMTHEEDDIVGYTLNAAWRDDCII